jgi:hypothetical protein
LVNFISLSSNGREFYFSWACLWAIVNLKAKKIESLEVQPIQGFIGGLSKGPQAMVTVKYLSGINNMMND